MYKADRANIISAPSAFIFSWHKELTKKIY